MFDGWKTERVLSVDVDGVLKMGWYMNKLLEFVQIFDQLFTNFSAFERESAITKISEVNQMSLHEENADEFFISEAGFLHLDFRD